MPPSGAPPSLWAPLSRGGAPGGLGATPLHSASVDAVEDSAVIHADGDGNAAVLQLAGSVGISNVLSGALSAAAAAVAAAPPASGAGMTGGGLAAHADLPLPGAVLPNGDLTPPALVAAPAAMVAVASAAPREAGISAHDMTAGGTGAPASPEGRSLRLAAGTVTATAGAGAATSAFRAPAVLAATPVAGAGGSSVNPLAASSPDRAMLTRSSPSAATGDGVATTVSLSPGSAATAVAMPLRFLMVDDDRSGRLLAIRFLQRRFIGCTVVEAVDGQHALDVLAATTPPFDVVCIDANMPRMDGYTAVAEMRRRGYTGLIVGVTGNALPEDLDRFRACGCDDATTKPITDALQRAITEGLRRKRR